MDRGKARKVARWDGIKSEFPGAESSIIPLTDKGLPVRAE